MASGRDIKLTKQVGEYLVAAELARRGFQCATFSGNIHYYDILAVDAVGRLVPVQVKAIRSGSWQFNLDRYLDINLHDGMQTINDYKPCPVEGLVCILVQLRKYGEDVFYLLTWSDLQSLLGEHHTAYLAKVGGIRPKRPDSTHAALFPADLEAFKDNWSVLESKLKR